MKEISIISGKGGTGKTSITAAFSSISQNTLITDIDVEAPDLHLVLHPELKERYIYTGRSFAQIDTSKCTNCGKCAEYCKFNAIINKDKKYEINEFSCEGCGLCSLVCPNDAIIKIKNTRNYCMYSQTRFGELFHAYLQPGEENSGRLIQFVRSKAKKKAMEKKYSFIVNDGPPGIGCTAISSITKTDAVVIVLEPSKSSFHDAIRLIDLINKFSIPIYAIINKSDVNQEISLQIKNYFETIGVDILASLEFDKDMMESIIQSKTICEYKPNSNISLKLKKAWNQLVQDLK
ncbi:MAG: ATP-binding protein [Marinifilaceae bacterium]|nr:ATP-binding protein [Marinifilaceae bacterium]